MSNLPTVIEAHELAAPTGRLDENPAAVYLAGLAAGSRPAMEQALNNICGVLGIVDPNEGLGKRDTRRVKDQRYLSFPWHELRFQHTAAIRARLEERYNYKTANKALSALRGVLKAAWKLGLMPAEAYQAAASVEGVKGESVPAGRSIPQGELVALLNTCEQTPAGVRDAAMISILYTCGLRRAEIVALDLADYDRAAGVLRVRGKRNKVRLVYPESAAEALADWLAIRGHRPGPLFWGEGNNNRGNRLTTQAVYYMLQTRAAAAGIKELSPHDFRRTFVGDLLEAGADIATVQKLAGHADITTTARYDRRGEKSKRRAAGLLHIPYTRRTLPVEEKTRK
ncbi:MAG: tyrosine-type recombinase/integrase [Chloroflexi bacterium]|nr:tyrosine-type recombinase/integrase [Chloroflexota bacterium]